MIGNGYPFRDTGFSVLEEGDINPTTLALDVRHFWAVDRQANMLAKFPTRKEAEAYLEEYLRQQAMTSQQ